MAQSLIETILGTASGAGVKVRPDYIVLNDGPSHYAVEGVQKAAAPERVIIYYDHDVPAGSSETSEIYAKLFKFAADNCIRFEQAQGVGYLHMLGGIVKGGDIVVGGGNHMGIFGANGALGLRLDTPALSDALRTGECAVAVPQTVRFGISGKLPQGVSVMDAGLRFLADNDIAGKAVEFVGQGLSDNEKAALCAIVCVRGAFTALWAENGAWDGELMLDKAEPMVMLPCGAQGEQMAAEIVPLSTIAGTPLQAGQIGGYTGGTIEDLRMAARMTQNRSLARGFRLSICPATSDDYLAAVREGVIETLIMYGAQIHAVGDRSIVRQGPGTIDEAESLLTTGLYTFDGCMGMSGSKVYCASVQAVMEASAKRAI